VRDLTEVIKMMMTNEMRDLNFCMQATVVGVDKISDGFPVSDHILLNNITFDLDVVVSNISLFDENLEISWDESTQSFETLGEPTLDSHITMRSELKALVLGRKVFSLLITEDNSFKQDIEQKEQQLLKSIVDQYDNCACNR
jgi:hypothetical protein